MTLSHREKFTVLNRLRELPNPYDFANPVHDARLFFGRTEEVADISYYLNHAQKTKHPIHLAFVGARASGKTSFLNIAELEARRKDFCTVRINLNEGDVETELGFFRKLFHSVLMAAFNCGAFGGKNGKSYFSYLDLVSTYEVTDTENLPLVFAYQLSRALKSQNKDLHVADDILAEDLKSISEEVRKPIVVLFDECNVLRANRVILEKLRNIFMNMSGYMLVFAATDDFFPMMDEVFSPIMRQFKKVEIC
jgi:Cdc6-like AAA superfamily ATPase